MVYYQLMWLDDKKENLLFQLNTNRKRVYYLQMLD